MHLGAAGDVDDEVGPRIGHELSQVRGDRDVEAAGELDAGRPRIDIGHAQDGHGGVADEHLEQGSPALARTDDDHFRHTSDNIIGDGRETRPRSEGGLGLAVELGHVLEARVLRQEHDLDGADRSVPLLPDDDLGDVRLVGRQILLVC